MKSKTYLTRVTTHEVQKQNGPRVTYEGWSAMLAKDEDGEVVENTRANPDSLAEGTSYFGDAQPSRAQVLMGDAVTHLQGRQKAVYMLTMREGHSIAQAAKKLGLGKSTAQTYRERALNFIQQYCTRHANW